jgi:hypothetical protein
MIQSYSFKTVVLLGDAASLGPGPCPWRRNNGSELTLLSKFSGRSGCYHKLSTNAVVRIITITMIIIIIIITILSSWHIIPASSMGWTTASCFATFPITLKSTLESIIVNSYSNGREWCSFPTLSNSSHPWLFCALPSVTGRDRSTKSLYSVVFLMKKTYLFSTPSSVGVRSRTLQRKGSIPRSKVAFHHSQTGIVSASLGTKWHCT